MPDNHHTDDQLKAFMDEMVEFVTQQRNEMLSKIAEFHKPNCTAPEGAKESCLLAFTTTFINLLQDIVMEKEAKEMLNG